MEKRGHPTWITLKESDSKPAVHVNEQFLLYDKNETFNDLVVRNPDTFVSGEIHNCSSAWLDVTKRKSDNMSETVQTWVESGIDALSFMRSFKGNYKGRPFDSDIPPKQFFPNAPSCKSYTSFIRGEINERLKNGSFRLWGKVGECSLPKVIMPLTVEPSKPRLCHDARFINLWTRDLPFSLDTLKDVHRLVEKDAHMICCDEKSGYDHIKLTRESEEYFGVQFGGWVFTYTTLPFGWKASPYIYQMLGMQVTSLFRDQGLNTIQYIDDRFMVFNSKTSSKMANSLTTIDSPIKMVSMVVTSLTTLGYTLALKKCQLIPSTLVRYLGFYVDSKKQAYLLPNDKKEKFMALRETILSYENVDVRTLQRFAGKCVSMSLVIPGAKLYTREINAAISIGLRNSRKIKMSGALLEEVKYWRFVDGWKGCAPWRPERHLQVSISTDASLYRYGVAIMSGKDKGEAFGDFWAKGDIRPIHQKEATAVLKALQSLKLDVQDHRVDLFVDNMAVVCAWENQGSRDVQLSAIMKKIFQMVCVLNVDLKMHYVESKSNLADYPSRKISYVDSMLSVATWGLVDSAFGPHTVDLMATDSNVMRDSEGVPLRHFTQYPSPQSAGVNVFAQELSKEVNPYVFPPFSLILPVLCLLREHRLPRCTLVVPSMTPKPIWWPLLMSFSIASIKLGGKGDKNVLMCPSKLGFLHDMVGLKWDLKAYRMDFS